jgi:hypothetical protein
MFWRGGRLAASLLSLQRITVSRHLVSAQRAHLTLSRAPLGRVLVMFGFGRARRRLGRARLSAVLAALILCAFEVVFLGHRSSFPCSIRAIGGGSLAISRRSSISFNCASAWCLKFLLATVGLARLFPELMGADTYLFVGGKCHDGPVSFPALSSPRRPNCRPSRSACKAAPG